MRVAAVPRGLDCGTGMKVAAVLRTLLRSNRYRIQSGWFGLLLLSGSGRTD